MKIEVLAIFSRRGEARLVEFGPGLNIVTGWSSTGKSSLLDIAEFCLGRRHPTYAAGVISQRVGWFGVQVEHNGARISIVRPAPSLGSATNQSATLLHGVELRTVDVTSLAINADVDAVRAEITQLLEIRPNEIRSPGLVRPRLEATASQALLFCFQAQDEIASSVHLFHRAVEQPIAEVLRDTLPFFLGAVTVDTSALANQLRQRNRDLRILTRRLEQARQSAARAPIRARTLYAQAAALGLVTPGPDVDAVDGLRAAVNDGNRYEDRPTPTTTVTEPLRERQRALIRQISGLEHQLSTILGSARDRQDYGAELGEQRHRLAAIGIVDDTQGDASNCPICGNHLTEPDETIDAMLGALAELDRRLSSVRTLAPMVEAAGREIEGKVGDLRSELSAVDAELRAATEADAQLALEADAQRDRSFLSGRIAEFMATLPPSDDTVGRLQTELTAVTADVERLEAALDPADVRERTESMLRLVSLDLSQWARDLKLGYSETSVQISLGALSVVADTREGPVALERMGSAANIIGYHVSAHLALHKWFVEQSRPVPAFLMLDQPSQAFFPDEVQSETDDALADDDRERVRGLYQLIRDVVESVDGGLQVIVVDHANLDIDWFQNAIVENWRRGQALVPAAWLVDDLD